jgi:hypothetical protein
MRPIHRHLTFANVASAIALFVALSGGTAVALSGTNTVFTDDIANDTQPASGGNPACGLVAADLRSNSVASSEVSNGSLNDEDVGQGTFVNFAANVGTVGAGSCSDLPITGVNAQGDHLLLTPSNQDSLQLLDYRMEYRDTQALARLVVCNHTNINLPDGITHFNLLVFDAH